MITQPLAIHNAVDGDQVGKENQNIQYTPGQRSYSLLTAAMVIEGKTGERIMTGLINLNDAGQVMDDLGRFDWLGPS